MCKSERSVDVLIDRGDIKGDGKSILDPFKKGVSQKNQDKVKCNERLVVTINEIRVLSVINKIECRKVVRSNGLTVEV